MTTWSKYQLTIFDAMEHTNNSLNVEACAGSGKTTTIVEGAKYLSGSSKFMAFNKSIATALAAKLPPAVAASTFNSAGFAEVRSRIKTKLDARKTKNIAMDTFAQPFEIAMAIESVLRLAKSIGFYTPLHKTVSYSDWITLIDKQLYIPEGVTEETFVELCDKTLKKSNKLLDIIDFDDQLYFPVLLDWYLTKYDNVICDEAQDISPIQQELIARMTDKSGRNITIGDSHQAIYAFRGADSSSMSSLRARFSAMELHLPISYRCPRKIIELAQGIVPTIQPAPNAIEGEINHLYYSDWLQVVRLDRDDMVLCRNNAPLFSLAVHLLNARIPFNIKGEFADILLRFVKSFKAKTIKEFHVRLRAWYETEYEKYTIAERWGKVQQVQDKFDSLSSLAKDCTSVETLMELLNSLVRAIGGVTLSSIHRAKGLETPHVHLLYPSLIPSRYANTPEAIQQEQNLQYVAITRAMQTFTLVYE